MKLYSIGVFMDASLFCQKPCVLIAYNLDSSDHDFYNQNGENVQHVAIDQLAKIGIDLTLSPSSTDSSLPAYIQLANNLAEVLMQRLDLFCEPVNITWDENQKRVFVAFPERDRVLTLNVVALAIDYVISLFSKDGKNNQFESSGFLDNLKYILNDAENRGKSRAVKELQECLMAGEKPWISLDFNNDNKNWLQIGFGRQQQVLDDATSFTSSYLGVVTSLSKLKSQEFLAQLGFPVTRQAVVSNAKQACQKAGQFGYPVVLKSDVGAFGDLVYSDLRDCDEVSKVFHILEKERSRYRHNYTVFVENFVQGKVYRVEVFNGLFFDAYDMVQAGVTGDGKHTVKELVDIENLNPDRGNKNDADAIYIKLKLNEAEQLMLKKQGYTFNSIPEKGQVVRLRANSNWSSGGTFEKVTEQVHPDNQRLAERVARALKIDLIGIDLITDDISKSFIEGGLTIIEVNHSPAVFGVYDENTDRSDYVGQRVVERMLPDVVYGDVPVIMFRSTPMASESETLLSKCLNNLDYSTGLINQQGLFVDGQIWATPEQVDYQNPGLQLLRNNTVGAAIVGRSAEDLIYLGLSSGGCDISVILDSENENFVNSIWPDGVQSIQVDKFLCLSARLANIVLVDNAYGIKLCKQCETDKLFAIFLSDAVGLEQSLDAAVNRIKVLQQTGEGVLLAITHNKHQFEKLLNCSGIENVLPYLVVLATLLVLDWELEKIWDLFENINPGSD